MAYFSRIIIFTISPMNGDFAKRYGVDFLERNGVEVIFLNLCPVIFGREKTKKTGWDKLGKYKKVTKLALIVIKFRATTQFEKR